MPFTTSAWKTVWTKYDFERYILNSLFLAVTVTVLNVFLAALAIHDLRTRGRLHPVTLWGGGIVVISEVLRFAIGFSAPWQAFAKALMG